jgi:hypothetical protein
MAKAGDGSEERVITPELKDLRSRKTYVQLRIPRIRDEIKSLFEQRKAFRESPRDPGGKPEERRHIVETRIYLGFELERLKSELKCLEQERDTIRTKLRAMGPGEAGPGSVKGDREGRVLERRAGKGRDPS